jgi:hypothetical protein
MTTETLLKTKPFSAKTLEIDPEAETARIVEKLRFQLGSELRKRGLVLGAWTPVFVRGLPLAPWVPRTCFAFSCRNTILTQKAWALGVLPPPHSVSQARSKTSARCSTGRDVTAAGKASFARWFRTMVVAGYPRL